MHMLSIDKPKLQISGLLCKTIMMEKLNRAGELSRIAFKKASGLEVTSQVNAFLEKNGGHGASRDSDLFFLAMLDGTVVGSVRFCIEESTPMLRTMMIEEDFRKLGVGSKLLKLFQEYLDANSIRDTFCVPYSHLRAFYSKIGFEPCDESTAPPFLKERIVGYRARNPEKHYALMKRTGGVS